MVHLNTGGSDNDLGNVEEAARFGTMSAVLNPMILDEIKRWDENSPALVARHLHSKYPKHLKDWYNKGTIEFLETERVKQVKKAVEQLFITEPKKTLSLSSRDELDSGMSSSFRGNPVRKNGEDVIKRIGIFTCKILSGAITFIEPIVGRGEIITVLAVKK